PERAVLLGLVLREALEHVEHTLRQSRLDGRDVRIFLQQLARDVERQVARVDDPSDEAQIERQELRCGIGDEDALDVELEPPRRLAVPQIERRDARQIQEARVFALALDAIVRPCERLPEIVRDVLVELDVLAVRALAARTGPERFRLIDDLGGSRAFAQLHRERDVVGVLADQAANPGRIEELLRVVAQEEPDERARLGLRPVLDRELALPVRFPEDACLGRLPRLTAFDLDALRDDERGVEAHAELADQLRVLALIAGQPLDEALRAGMGDRAELLDDLVARHADAVVRDRNGLRALVDRDDDLEVRGLRRELLTRQRLEAQFVVRVRGVRDQLAKENLAVAVKRMH